MNTLKLKLIVILILASVCGWLVTRPRPTEAQGPNHSLFVRGFVAAAVTNIVDTATTAAPKSKDIALPNAKVVLVPFNDLDHPVASALTDLSGRFALKTAKTGTFTVCIEAQGFPRFCPQKEFRLFRVSQYLGTLRLPVPRSKTSATAFGDVMLADGSVPRGFQPFLGVNAFSKVKLTVGTSTKYDAFVNNLGEYIIPEVPVESDFTLTASIEKEARDRKIRKQTKLQPGRSYPIDFVL